MKLQFLTLPRVVITATAFFFITSICARATIYNWTNAAGGGWNAATNWNPNGVPGLNDTATITNAGVTVSLNGSTTVAGIILGTNGAGTVTLALAGQTLGLNGPLTVNPSGSFTVSGGGLVGNTNAILHGTIGWTAGYLAGTLTLASGSTLNITSGNNHDLQNCTVTNNGTVTWSTGEIRGGGNPGTLVYNYGMWNAQDDSVWDNAFGGFGTVFNNYGTLRKSGGASEFANATIFQGGCVFNQLAGIIDVQNGTNGLELAFQGGGNFSGGYVTTNQFGLTVLSLGSFNVNGTVTGTNTWEDAGNLVGANVIKGALTWVAGVWNGAAIGISTNSALLITSGNNHDLQNCTVTNNGTVTWSTGEIRGGGNPGTLVYNYGMWNAQDDSVWDNAFGGFGTVFNNYGTLRKSGGASEFANATIFQGGCVFNQLAGIIDVQNGTNGLELAFQGGGNFSGGYVTTNQFGLTVLSLGSFNVNGTVTGTNTWEDAGNLVGANVIKGALTWVAGVWNGAAIGISTNSVVLVAGGGGNMDMNAVLLTNNGTLVWSSGHIRDGNGAAIYNYGLWDAKSDQSMGDDFGGASVFNNFGTFRKSGGIGSTTIANGVLFNQTSGLLTAQTGNVVLQGGGNFNGGVINNSSVGMTYLSLGGFNLNGTTTDTNVVENAGNLVGANVIKGALTWVAGVWNGAVVSIPASSTVLVAGGGGNMDMNAVLLTNNGTLVWSSGHIRDGNGAAIYNYGLWDAKSDQSMGDDFGGSSVFNNFGTFRKSGGIGSTTIANGVLFNQTSGLLTAQTGNVVLQGGGNFNGGVINNSSVGMTYLSLGGFNLNGTTTDTNVVENAGNLVGANVIKGALTWVAGVWNGAVVSIPASSTVLVAGGGGNMDMNAVLLTNNGTLVWSSGHIRDGNGAAIYNYGLWDAKSDQSMGDDFGGSSVFNNFGTFRKSGGIGSTTIANGVLFNQTSGLLTAQTGNVVLQGGGNFNGGVINNSSVGMTYLSLGGFNLNGTTTDTNVVENAGNLVGANVIKGALTWVAGVWNGAVVSIPASSTVLVAGGGGNMDMNAVLLTNSGTLVWSSGHIREGNGSAIYNYGLWTAQSDQSLGDDFGGASVFNNFGTFRKNGTTGGSSLFQNGVIFNNPGTLDVQTGNVNLQGTYNLTNGTLSFRLNSITNFGQLSLAGSANLSGPLVVNVAGAYAPTVGDQFQVVTSAGVNGTFNSVSVPAGISVNYSNNGVFLKVTGLVPVQIFDTRLSGTNLLFQFDTVSGQSYTIQWNADLTTNNWAFYTNITGNGTVFQFQTPIMATPAQSFFRVREP